MENTYPNYQSKAEITNAIDVLTRLYAIARSGLTRDADLELSKITNDKIKELIAML